VVLLALLAFKAAISTPLPALWMQRECHHPQAVPYILNIDDVAIDCVLA